MKESRHHVRGLFRWTPTWILLIFVVLSLPLYVVTAFIGVNDGFKDWLYEFRYAKNLESISAYGTHRKGESS